MDWKYIGALVAVLAVGLVIGALAFPRTVVETQTKTITETVKVPVEKIVEVPVTDTAQLKAVEDELQRMVADYKSLATKYEELKERYEQVAERAFDEKDLVDELAAINKAKSELQDEWMYLFLKDDYKLSDLSIYRFYKEDAKVDTVERWVNGKKQDYDKATVTFEVKVKYEDYDGREYACYRVDYTWELDRDGNEEAIVDADEITC